MASLNQVRNVDGDGAAPKPPKAPTPGSGMSYFQNTYGTPTAPKIPGVKTPGSGMSYFQSTYGGGVPGARPVGADSLSRARGDSVYRNSEIARAQQVMADRQKSGLDVTSQRNYLNSLLGMQAGPTKERAAAQQGAAIDAQRGMMGSPTVRFASSTGEANSAQQAQMAPQAQAQAQMTPQAQGQQAQMAPQDAASVPGAAIGGMSPGDWSAFWASLDAMKAESQPDSQVMIASWMGEMSAQLAQIEAGVLEQIRKTGGADDPALQSALGALREQFDLSRQQLLEDMAARGLVQSGVILDVETKLNKGMLSEGQKLIAGRLSEMQSLLTQAVMQFANARIGMLQSGMEMKFQGQQNDLNRQMQKSLSLMDAEVQGRLTQLGQQFTSGENAAQRAWQGGQNDQDRALSRDNAANQLALGWANFGLDQTNSQNNFELNKRETALKEAQMRAATDAEGQAAIRADIEYIDSKIIPRAVDASGYQQGREVLMTYMNNFNYTPQEKEALLRYYDQMAPGAKYVRSTVNGPSAPTGPSGPTIPGYNLLPDYMR